MIKFSKDKVLLLHRLIAEETGGSACSLVTAWSFLRRCRV